MILKLFLPVLLVLASLVGVTDLIRSVDEPALEWGVMDYQDPKEPKATKEPKPTKEPKVTEEATPEPTEEATEEPT